MSLITCENLTLGYEGKAILSWLNFSVNSGDYLCIRRRKRLWEIHTDENPSSSSEPYERQYHSGRRFKNQTRLATCHSRLHFRETSLLR